MTVWSSPCGPGLGGVGAVVRYRVDIPSPDPIPPQPRVKFKVEMHLVRLSVYTLWPRSKNGFCIITADHSAR